LDARLAGVTCRVCGAHVTLIEAPMHAEDHAQAGEFPGPDA
jgi:hypothetical protein